MASFSVHKIRLWFGLFLCLPFLLIHQINSVCISSSTLAESLLSSSPSLCFNETDSNIFNHRLDPISNFTTIKNNEPNKPKSGLIKAESRQVLERVSSRNVQQKIPKHYGKKRKKIHYLSEIHPNQIRYYSQSNNPRKSVFIPVALYSVTKKLPKNSPKMSSSNVSVKRKQLNTDEDSSYENEDEDQQEQQDSQNEYEMRKESAVYGYIQKPEVIEFKGQYYYGDNGGHHEYNGRRSIPPDYQEDQMHAVYMPHEHHSHHDHDHHEIAYAPTSYESYHEPSLPALLMAKLKKAVLLKGITGKGLLLATLPLLLLPLLTYMFTPVVIPITATVAAGRRKRRKRHTINETTFFDRISPFSKYNNMKISTEETLKETMILLDYLYKIKSNEKLTKRTLANFFQCQGFFSSNDRCLEQLSCQFQNVSNEKESDHIEQKMASIILDYLLQRNEFVPGQYRERIKKAALYGKQYSLNGSKCRILFPCERLQSPEQ